MLLRLFTAAAVVVATSVDGFVHHPTVSFGVERRKSICRNHATNQEKTSVECPSSLEGTNPRRNFLLQTISASFMAITSQLGTPAQASAAAEVAIGRAEMECRQKGNCLEIGELDGAIGWTWGGKDRCDATDPRCGPDGQLLDEPVAGAPVPSPGSLKITHVMDMELTIGKREQAILRFGLYGEDCTDLVNQFLRFCDRSKGITTTSELLLEIGFGSISAPVKITNGGVLSLVYPGERLDFGVPSQAAAYAKSIGRAKATDNFVPQPKPSTKVGADCPSVRKHDVAGLLSVPAGGLGFGGGLGSGEDELFASAFQVTASAVPAMDKEGRKVIGQLLNSESMASLARLASIPTKKGLKGVIPGQSSGPPLLKVTVNRADINIVAS